VRFKVKTKVADIMSKKLITANRREVIKNVVKKMLKRDLRCLPVVDGKRLVGLISCEDIVKKVIFEKFSDFSQVMGAMATETETVSSGTKIEDLIKLMKKDNLKRVPIVDNDKLVGIVTQTDIVKYEADK
tara:strand:- start:1257 stop:1646 length:390 start_codon:yes stop_codon:yes gene_type:complete